METPAEIVCVIPSRLKVGEEFTAKIKILGRVREIGCSGQWNTRKPALKSPFNLNVQRGIRYVDNCLSEWSGTLRVAREDYDGPNEIVFDGIRQGVFPTDKRPLLSVSGMRWTKPGFHFLRLVESGSGLEAWSNPCYVSEEVPENRLYWGDPHWQTFFSDGIRCPEELYAFARDEAFLDFGAISDHMEAITDRQWDYFKAVTNDYNQPGVFVTLQGQEWTHHVPETGAPGHRNIYYRGPDGPALRCTDPDCDTLEKLWSRLDTLEGVEALAIPHHPANAIMGVKWESGWNEKYEKAVEIYSVWGSSEKPESAGNSRPIRNCGGEMQGRHVLDALKRGYQLGFVGGGDVHDGRAGDALHASSYPPSDSAVHYKNGLTALWVPALTRENVFDAIATRQTYAATCSRIYLETIPGARIGTGNDLRVRAASEQGIRELVMVADGSETPMEIRSGVKSVDRPFRIPEVSGEGFLYVRVETTGGEIAWSSPFYKP